VGNVLKMEKRQQVESLHKLGYGIRAINRMTGVHRGTIKRLIAKASEHSPAASDESAQTAPTTSGNQPVDPPPNSKSSVEPHRTAIAEKLALGLSAQRIYQDLVEEHAFTGSYDAVRRFVQKQKVDQPKYYARLVHTPGEEAQVDFGVGSPVLKDGKYRKCWLFKMTLSFSGHSYEELVWKQDVETFIRCHERAFRFFGGVPASVKLDNLKSGVLTASLYDPELNPVYLAFANHWGFAANPCPPYRPEHKGKVERDVGYTKDNALKGKKFDSLDAGNAYLKQWNFNWAQKRIHGGHREVVIDLFKKSELCRLNPCVDSDFSLFKIANRKVDNHGHIEVDSNFYSVPYKLIRQTLKVHYNSQFIKVCGHDGEMVAIYRPLEGKGKRHTQKDHIPTWNIPREREELFLCERALKSGVNCEELALKVLMDKADPIALRRARGIVYLDKKYSGTILERACGYVIESGDLRVQRVKAMCEKLAKEEVKPAKELTQEDECIRDPKEYALEV